jgi:acyl-CoA synthetase (AMP-forming)/AMP-acid ligase II
VRIVDRDGRTVASGENGELLVRGPNAMLGYYRAPELTAEVLDRDGWFRTGDLARADGEGNLFIAGRTKELIIRGAFNVYPIEVESVLNQHPAVSQCAVVGRAVPGDEEVMKSNSRSGSARLALKKVADSHAGKARAMPTTAARVIAQKSRMKPPPRSASSFASAYDSRPSPAPSDTRM